MLSTDARLLIYERTAALFTYSDSNSNCFPGNQQFIKILKLSHQKEATILYTHYAVIEDNSGAVDN